MNHWKKPIIIGRHTHGDHYDITDEHTSKAGKLTLKFEADDTSVGFEKEIYSFNKHGGIFQCVYNTDESIENFARSCFTFGLLHNLPVKLATLMKWSQKYDGRFRMIFDNIYEEEYRREFREAGLDYEHRNLDDMVQQIVKGDGGYLLALKNYDGDIISEIVGSGFGTQSHMFNTIVGGLAHDHTRMFESNHGTIKRHFEAWRRNDVLISNPTSTIYAWNEALRYRATLDKNDLLFLYAETMHKALHDVVDSGVVTKDVA